MPNHWAPRFWGIDLRKVRELLLDRHARTLPNFSVIRQPTSRSCWATCYRMLDQWVAPDYEASWCHYLRCARPCTPACEQPPERCNHPRRVDWITGDLHALGYPNTEKKRGPYALPEVQAFIGQGRPTLAFLEIPGAALGHFVLVVGTGRRRRSLGDTYILADPEFSRLTEVGVSEMPHKGFWLESWRIEW